MFQGVPECVPVFQSVPVFWAVPVFLVLVHAGEKGCQMFTREVCDSLSCNVA